MARKTEMKLISSKHARSVAFSKRRSSLFKEASKMCTLTGCEIAIGFISQSGRAHSFGHPSVESVSQWFLNETQRPVAQPAGESVTSRLNQEDVELRERLAAVKQRGKKLAEDRRRAQMPFWLDTGIHELPFEQLIKAKESLEKLKEGFEKRIGEISQRESDERSSMRANVPDLNFPPSDEI